MIPLFKPHFRKAEIFELMSESIDIGWTGQGFLTDEFEKQFCQYTGRKYGVMLNSASAALHLALLALKINRAWNENDEVISTPLTFVSSNHAILWSGLKPVLADVTNELCLDPQALLDAISPRTRAVIFVAMGGNSDSISEIERICHERGIALILDAAHAAGSRSAGEFLGKEADAICYSFQAVKNLPTADSGQLSMLDEAEHQLVRKLAWLGISESTYSRAASKSYKWEYEVDHVGYKYNANNVMAAMAIVGLKYLDQDNEERRSISSVYDKLFANEEKIQIIQHSNKTESSRHLYQITVPDRSELNRIFSKYEIGMGVHYRTNTSYPMYSQYRDSTQNATRLSDSIVSLPLFLGLNEDQQSVIVNAIIESTN